MNKVVTGSDRPFSAHVPVLIIGAGAVDMAAAGLGTEAHFLLLAALLVVAAAFAPWAAAAALRISAE